MKKFLLLSALAVTGLTMMAEDFTVTIDFEDGSMLKSQSSAPFAPLNNYYNNSDCQMIYTAQQLADVNLEAGSIINGLTLYGAYTGAQAGKLHGAYTVYMSETENTRFNSIAVLPMDADTQVSYTADYVLPQVGSMTEAEPLIGLNFQEPYTYNGGNLLIKIEYRSSSWDSGSYYYCDRSRADQIIVRGDDNATTLANKQWSNQSGLPKISFNCQGGTSVKSVADNAPAINVKGGVINAEAAAINVYNTNGVNVARANGSLDINSLPAGVYIINVRSEQGVSTMRIVK